jgi:PhnB protein
MSHALATAEVREGFTTLTPYVWTPRPGLAEFLSRAFGAVETHANAAPGGGTHRELRVGDSMMMIGEGGAAAADLPTRPAAFHVYVDDVDATFERALRAGAESMGAPEDRPYGERSGFVRDPFGNHWYIATHLGASAVPEGLRTVTPYLHPTGAPAYIDFLTHALGAVEEFRHQSPDGRIVYARLRIGNAAIELGEPEGSFDALPATFYLYVGDPDAVYAQALAAGATSLSAPAEQSYGERVASVEDAMGNRWFIARPV